jgi:hypothetical protein
MLHHEQVVQNINTIIQCGLDSAFLINHEVSGFELLDEADWLTKNYPAFNLGLNILDFPTQHALRSSKLPIWCDRTPTCADYNMRTSKRVFGGLAFKYQPQPDDLKTACENIKSCCDVATTSGDGTGIPASRSKIQLIRQYLGDFPLAVASGVSSENIKDYADLVDYVLVASSITDSNELIVKDKLLELVDKSCQT